MKKLLFPLLLLLGACQTPSAEMPSAQDVQDSKPLGKTQLYHNPISADKPLDPNEAAKMVFEEMAFDFGEIKEGESVEHVFKFKNTGKSPLNITNARGNCGCTVPKWPKEPLAPGEAGEIRVVFNSTGKKGIQEKDVYITANTIPNKTVLKIRANVAN